jgi:hypothetical protein
LDGGCSFSTNGRHLGVGLCSDVPEVEAVDIGVPDEAFQETFARRVAAHELLLRGVERLGMQEDGGVAHVGFLAR